MSTPFDTRQSDGDQGHEVDAIIMQWREGGTNRYAFATILTDGAVADTATCSEFLNDQSVPLGSPFRCRIMPKANGKGYRIVELIIEGLAETLPKLPAVVAGRRKDGVMAQARPLPEAPLLPVILPWKVLNEHHIADIVQGTEIIIDAQREPTGYLASALHYPGLAQALDPALSPHVLVVFPDKDWDREAPGDGLYATFSAPDASVIGKIWLSKNLLFACGIPSLIKNKLARQAKPEEHATLLDAWQDTLREGHQEDCALLEIDRVEIECEWVESKSTWRLSRLCRPRSVREPDYENEIIDWVSGKVCSEAMTKHQRQKPHATEPAKTYQSISIAYCDNRLGRGMVEVTGATRIQAAGLSRDVPVIFSLVATKGDWRLKQLHRATPARAGSAL
jgi:hypothetical protein